MVTGAALLACALLLLVAPASSSSAPRCTITGTPGPDALRGTRGPDVICGRGGRDQITGGRGVDRILGGPGADHLVGGPGKDALLGGKGNDSCQDSPDTIFASCERQPDFSEPRPKQHRPKPSPSNWPVPWPTTATQPPDEQAPDLVYVTFQQRFVDTSTGDTSVNLYVEAWDSSGIGPISIRIDGPSGPWRHLELEGEANERTQVNAAIDVPDTTSAGDYRITELTVSDRKGNARTLSQSELEESAYLPELAVFHGPDNEAPELASLSLSAAEVDTSNSPATVEISIGGRDALSGVNDTFAAVVLPTWEPGPLELTGHMGGEVPPTAGTRHEGVWTQSISLVQHAMPGTYKITGVYLSDLVGNKSHYKREDLEDLGFPLGFIQTGPGDTTAPEIVDFWMEPTTLRASHGERKIFFYVRARDDLTGFGQWPDTGLSDIRVGFEPPGDWDEFESSGRVPELISGTELDGVWRLETIVEAGAPPGEYVIKYVSATDRAGNDGGLKTAGLQSAGLQTAFVNLP